MWRKGGVQPDLVNLGTAVKELWTFPITPHTNVKAAVAGLID